MVYKVFYIEDLESESRKLDLESLGFKVEQYDPQRDMNLVVDSINSFNPDLIIMDYRLNSGSDSVYYDAPTIAATLRNKHRINFKEIPIILISNESKIADFYKDFLNQDLFDYAIEKQVLNQEHDFFKTRVISYINAYSSIVNFNFDLYKILGIDKGQSSLLHSSILKKLEPKGSQIYEYSRFVNDNLIYSIGTLIGEEVLAARLGVDKKSKDWLLLLEHFKHFEYRGIFSDTHLRWWAESLEEWWITISGINNLRRLNAQERLDVLLQKFNLDLDVASKTELSKSTKFWTICKGSENPIDPFDGIQIVKKDYKSWQEKEYFSKDYALEKIEKEKNFIDEIDLKYLKYLAKNIS